MNRIGLLRIERAKIGGDTWVAQFPETKFTASLETISSENEVITHEEFSKTYGYRLHLNFEITRLTTAFYSANYQYIDIEQQFIQIAKMLNEINKISLPNREFKVYPDYGVSDFYGLFILKSEELAIEKSTFIFNVGQTMNIEFCDKKYCDGETYYPYQGHSGFLLSDYLLIEEE